MKIQFTDDFDPMTVVWINSFDLSNFRDHNESI